MTKKILFSHGFGVEKTDRGLLTDIATALPDWLPIYTDFNIIDLTHNEMTVRPLEKQADILRQAFIDKVGKNDEVILIAHSQGCVVAGLADLPVSKSIFLTPASTENTNSFLQKFAGRKGTVINPQGISRLMRRDGSTTIVPRDYVQSLELIDFGKVYKQYSLHCKLFVVHARSDEVVRPVENFSDMTIVETLAGNHDFTNPLDRKQMTERISEYIVA